MRRKRKAPICNSWWCSGLHAWGNAVPSLIGLSQAPLLKDHCPCFSGFPSSLTNIAHHLFMISMSEARLLGGRWLREPDWRSGPQHARGEEVSRRSSGLPLESCPAWSTAGCKCSCCITSCCYIITSCCNITGSLTNCLLSTVWTSIDCCQSGVIERAVQRLDCWGSARQLDAEAWWLGSGSGILPSGVASRCPGLRSALDEHVTVVT